MKILVSWSSGKDSAWTLQTIRAEGIGTAAALLTTVNEAMDRVAMHGVRADDDSLAEAVAGLVQRGAFDVRQREEGIDAPAEGIVVEDLREGVVQPLVAVDVGESIRVVEDERYGDGQDELAALRGQRVEE